MHTEESKNQQTRHIDPDQVTLLFVDDDPYILSAMQRVFRHSPYRVLVAQNPIKALQILEEEQVDIMVTDQLMPRMTGVELCRKVKEMNPSIIRVILSAYADVPALLGAINQGEVYRFLQKPYDMARIREIIDRIVQQATVVKAFKSIVKKFEEEGSRFNYNIDYTGQMIEIGLDGEETPMDEQTASCILKCLMQWPEMMQQLKVISTVLHRQNGNLNIRLEFGGGLHLAVSLPIKEKAGENGD